MQVCVQASLAGARMHFANDRNRIENRRSHCGEGVHGRFMAPHQLEDAHRIWIA